MCDFMLKEAAMQMLEDQEFQQLPFRPFLTLAPASMTFEECETNSRRLSEHDSRVKYAITHRPESTQKAEHAPLLRLHHRNTLESSTACKKHGRNLGRSARIRAGQSAACAAP